MRKTKIVATLGPATDAPGVLEKLVSFVDVFRCNASHGEQADHRKRIEAVRQLACEAKREVAVLLDLQGPKIRLDRFEGGKAMLETGSRFRITTEEVLGNSERASTSYTDLARDVKPGDRVLIADGSVELRVLSSNGVEANCEVVAGGMIGDRKGINLPGVAVSSPSLTKKDVSDLRFGIDMQVDLIALSFVRKREDVLRLRMYLEDAECNIPIIAKIEKPEAVDRLDEIVAESDGLMVARGDLGVELALEKVPFVQKRVIEKARQSGKFVITATQMLESMIQNPFPTRAEVSDIANAIYDGTDAVMLSAETSVGAYPVEAATMMSRIADESERSLPYAQIKDVRTKEHPEFPEIIADAAFRAARFLKASAIVVFTSTGKSARLASSYRPSVPIYAFTPDQRIARQLAPIYGVQGIFTSRMESMESMFGSMDDYLREHGGLKHNDTVVLMAGAAWGRPGSTSLIKLHRVGSED